VFHEERCFGFIVLMGTKQERDKCAESLIFTIIYEVTCMSTFFLITGIGKPEKKKPLVNGRNYPSFLYQTSPNGHCWKHCIFSTRLLRQ
jgi:hypothetical protein